MRARDEQGAQEFLRHYGALVRYVAEPVLEDPGACEDCLQEVVHRVWERIESFSEGRGSFKAWITAITRNLALNMKRSQRSPMRSWTQSLQIPDRVRRRLRSGMLLQRRLKQPLTVCPGRKSC